MSPRRRVEHRQHGFTLLEVMVALAVLAFAFVALLGLHGRNVALTARTNDYSRATLFARELMTQMQFEDFGSIGDATGAIPSDPRFHWVRQVSPTSLDNVKQIRLRVIWDDNRPDACEIIYWIAAPTA